MTRRPGARALTIRELMERAQRGELRIPTFQRKLRWDNEDRVALLDSVERGYPIGTVLFWQRAAERGVGGLFDALAPEQPRAWWIIDGQQRLRTLADALLRAALVGAIALGFELGADRFAMRRHTKDGGDVVPASVLLDNADLSQWAVDERLARVRL